MLIADPDITYYNLKKGCKFIILATDGLWDVFTGLPYFQKYFYNTCIQINLIHT